MTHDKNVTHSGNESRVQNAITDCLDFVLDRDLDEVTFTSGLIPIFRKRERRFPRPEFNDPIEEQDLTDYLEALELNFQAPLTGMTYRYHSSIFTNSTFCFDIFPSNLGHKETIVRFSPMETF